MPPIYLAWIPKTVLKMTFWASVLVPSNVYFTLQSEWTCLKGRNPYNSQCCYCPQRPGSLTLVCNALKYLLPTYIPILISHQFPFLSTELNAPRPSHLYPYFLTCCPLFLQPIFLPYWLLPTYLLGLSLTWFLHLVRLLYYYPLIFSLLTLILHCCNHCKYISSLWEWKFHDGPVRAEKVPQLLFTVICPRLHNICWLKGWTNFFTPPDIQGHEWSTEKWIFLS